MPRPDQQPDSTFANPDDFTDPPPMTLDEAWLRIKQTVQSCTRNGSDLEALDVVDHYLEVQEEWEWTKE